jgi:PhoPQ-activated pathogenicity-related protein
VYFDVCKKPEWWRKLAAVHQLLQPFVSAIHILEGDKALLSQVIIKSFLISGAMKRPYA